MSESEESTRVAGGLTYQIDVHSSGTVHANIDVNLSSIIGKQRMQKFINLLQRELTQAELNQERRDGA